MTDTFTPAATLAPHQAASASPDTSTAAAVTSAPTPDTELLTQDLLVEDVSIDGMCGVY